MEIAQVKWVNNMKFEAAVRDHNFVVDTTSEFGGENSGPKPVELVLLGLISCTGMDVVYILKKMKQQFTEFTVTIDNVVRAEEHPRVYTKIHMIFKIVGENIKIQKVKEAVELSQDKYCSVSGMLDKSAKITYDLYVNNMLQD